MLVDGMTAEQVGSQGLDVRTATQIENDSDCS
jgi:hypothetical protein